MRSIHWGRVIVAGMLAEVAVAIVIGSIVGGYALLGAADATQRQAFAAAVGSYVGPSGGALTTLLFAWLIGRRLESARIANGTAVGVVAMLVTAGFLFTARPDDRALYAVALALKVGAGYLGGALAERGARERCVVDAPAGQP